MGDSGPGTWLTSRGHRRGAAIERFGLAEPRSGPAEPLEPERAGIATPVTTRRVSTTGTISFAAVQYKAGAGLAGQQVEVVCGAGLVQLHHRGVLIATHARRHAPGKQQAAMTRGRRLPPARRTTTTASVTRKVDSSGNVCFAGTNYRVGHHYRRRQVQVAVVGDTVEISVGNSSSDPTPSNTTALATRSARQPRRPTQPHQRRLTGSVCQVGTGVKVCQGVPGLDMPLRLASGWCQSAPAVALRAASYLGVEARPMIGGPSARRSPG